MSSCVKIWFIPNARGGAALPRLVHCWVKGSTFGQKGALFALCHCLCRRKSKVQPPPRRCNMALCHYCARQNCASRNFAWHSSGTVKCCTFLAEVAPSIFCGTGSGTAQKVHLFGQKWRLCPKRVGVRAEQGGCYPWGSVFVISLFFRNVKVWFLGARGAPASLQLTEFQPRFSICSVQALRACTEKTEKRD